MSHKQAIIQSNFNKIGMYYPVIKVSGGQVLIYSSFGTNLILSLNFILHCCPTEIISSADWYLMMLA